MKEKAAGNGGATGKRHKSGRQTQLGAEPPNWFGFYRRDKHNRRRWDMSQLWLCFAKTRGHPLGAKG